MQWVWLRHQADSNSEEERGPLSECEDSEKLRYGLVKQKINVEGMGVGLMAKNGRGFIIGFFAIIKLNAVAVPISNQLKRDELDELISESLIHCILDDLNGIVPIIEESSQKIIIKERFRFSHTTHCFSEPFAKHVDKPAPSPTALFAAATLP